MKYKIFLVACLMASVFSSCDQKVKDEAWEDETLPKPEIAKEGDVSDYQYILAKVDSINANLDTDYKYIRSLRWEYASDTANETIQVMMYFTDEHGPAKIIEKYYEQVNERQGEKTYYFDEENLILTENLFDKWADVEGGMMHQEQVFYENGEEVYARKKKAVDYYGLADVSWEENENPEIITTEIASRIIKQLAPFQTYFISTIQSGNNLFLLLGQPKEGDRYVTVVRVDDIYEPFIIDLLKNKKEYKFRPIMVQFDVVGGGDDPEFRVLKGAKWLDEELEN